MALVVRGDSVPSVYGELELFPTHQEMTILSHISNISKNVGCLLKPNHGRVEAAVKQWQLRRENIEPIVFHTTTSLDIRKATRTRRGVPFEGQ